jgi:hypothetical protein
MLLSPRLALAACLGCLAASCGPPPNAIECAALLDRYVTLLANSDHPGTDETELMRLREEARQKAARDPAFRECPSRVSRREYDCAMSAENADRFEQCLL